jgi:hypothetical protein
MPKKKAGVKIRPTRRVARRRPSRTKCKKKRQNSSKNTRTEQRKKYKTFPSRSKLGINIIRAICNYLSPHDFVHFYYMTKFTSEREIIETFKKKIEEFSIFSPGLREGIKKHTKYEDYSIIIFDEDVGIKNPLGIVIYGEIQPIYTKKLVINILDSCYHADIDDLDLTRLHYVPPKLKYFSYECNIENYDDTWICEFSDSLVLPSTLEYLIIKGPEKVREIDYYKPKNIILWCATDIEKSVDIHEVGFIDELIKFASMSNKMLIVDHITKISSYIFNTFDNIHIFEMCEGKHCYNMNHVQLCIEKDN